MRADADLVAVDLYELLGVSEAAKSAEIRAAYRRRARESHPDLNPLDPASGAGMTRLNRAARLLLDPARRAAYDRARGNGPVAARRASAWYDRKACGSDWESPRPVASPTSAAARRYRRRVRSSGDALALRAAEWVLKLERGERLMFAAVCIALGSGLLMWVRPVNAFWTSPAGEALSSGAQPPLR